MDQFGLWQTYYFTYISISTYTQYLLQVQYAQKQANSV